MYCIATTYATAVLKSGTIYDELKHVVKTKSGDDAIIFDTPKDGNCLVTAMVRGFNSGFPLSPAIEDQAMLNMRELLSTYMRNHQWPHPWVASPQSIDECIISTATPGQWCGELAIASLATISGCEIQLWRYINDKGSAIAAADGSSISGSGIIEHMCSPINHNDINTHCIIHLLQTRDHKPGRPEHNSHWQSVHMLPVHVPSTTIEYGPSMVERPFTYYDYIHDNTCSPPLRITIKDMVKIKGRGASDSVYRFVHRIRQLHGGTSSSGPLQFVVISLDKTSKGNHTHKLLCDIIPSSVRAATIAELTHATLLLSRVSLSSSPLSMSNTSTPIPMSADNKRKRAQTKLFVAPTPSTPKKKAVRRSPSSKKKTRSISSSDDEVEELKQGLKKKCSGAAATPKSKSSLLSRAPHIHPPTPAPIHTSLTYHTPIASTTTVVRPNCKPDADSPTTHVHHDIHVPHVPSPPSHVHKQLISLPPDSDRDLYNQSRSQSLSIMPTYTQSISIMTHINHLRDATQRHERENYQWALTQQALSEKDHQIHWYQQQLMSLKRYHT